VGLCPEGNGYVDSQSLPIRTGQYYTVYWRLLDIDIV